MNSTYCKQTTHRSLRNSKTVIFVIVLVCTKFGGSADGSKRVETRSAGPTFWPQARK